MSNRNYAALALRQIGDSIRKDRTVTLTRLERETGIIWNDAEDDATIWSTSPVQIRRFSRQFGPGTQKGTECMEWIVPKARLAVRSRRKVDPSNLSEAQKAARAKFAERGAK